MEYQTQYELYRLAVEDYLAGLFTQDKPWNDLQEAMRYSLLSGGKRIRPVLTLEFARLCGLDWHVALPFACALELVHTYSLIHDDLPCMDDDDLRRGKPTNHKVYGETLAILAGDAMQPEAFRLMLTAPEIPVERRAECALLLARAAGADGMVAGQVLDTLHHLTDQAGLTQLHNLKTGAMIAAACQLGCAAAGAEESACRQAERFGYALGLAFQIRDDMLDVMGDAATFGKPIGSDAQVGKVTFVNLLGLEGCEAAVRSCTQEAKDAVAQFSDTAFLQELADTMALRNV